MKKFTNKKRLELAVIFGLICAVMMSFSHFDAACEDLRTNVLRLHIIANSDSEADQNIKLKVRDAILSETSQLFDTNTDLNGALNSARNSLPEFEKTALRVLEENGFEYSAKAEIGDSYFETREYDDFTLPAGTYKSLIIRLGDAKGKNWWCVVFPGVCIPAASKSELTDSVTEESAAVAEDSQRYIMQFKAVEIYEKLKKIIK